MRRRRALVALLAGVAALVLTELGARVLADPTEPALDEVVASMVLPLEEENPLEFTPHPFFAWSRPEWREELAHAADGSTREALEVLVVGGALARALETAPGDPLAIALGSPTDGARVPRVAWFADARLAPQQTLTIVDYALQSGRRPAAVVRVDSFADLARAAADVAGGVHPLTPSPDVWGAVDRSAGAGMAPASRLVDAAGARRRARTSLAKLARFGLDHSALVTRLVRGRFEARRSAFDDACADFARLAAAAPRPSLQGPRFDAHRGDALLAGVWTESSRSLDAICRARDVRYVHVLRRSGDARLSRRLREAVEAGARELRDAGVALVDLDEAAVADLDAIAARIAAALTP